MKNLATTPRQALLPDPARTTRRIAVGAATLVAAALVTAPAGATDISDTQVAPFDFSMSAGQASVAVPQFDDLDGARSLESVSFHVEIAVGGDVFVENPDPVAYDDVAVELDATVAASVGGLFTTVRYSSTFYADHPIAKSDGAAGGPDSYDFGHLELLDSGQDTATADLGAFIGKGSVDVSIDGIAAFLPLAEYEHWDWTFSDVAASGQVSITYTYADTTHSSCDADLDGDGFVGFGDVLEVLGAWGACPVIALCPEDVQPDGMVGASDLFLVLTRWGACN